MLRAKPCILAVDDDAEVLRLVRRALELERYHVTTAESGEAAMAAIAQQVPDLVVLDIMMPGTDGYTVCRRVRGISQVPIILLTAKASSQEMVSGLDAGADDYVTKPFSVEVLLARVRAAFRRSSATPPSPSCDVFYGDNLKVDFDRRLTTVDGKEIRLTPTEFRLLQELVLKAGKVLTHAYLLSHVWGPEYRDERQYLHVFIRNLRGKLKLGRPGYGFIDNLAGVGYRFRA